MNVNDLFEEEGTKKTLFIAVDIFFCGCKNKLSQTVCGTVGIQIDAFDAAQTQDSTMRLTCLYPQFTRLHLYSILLLTLKEYIQKKCRKIDEHFSNDIHNTIFCIGILQIFNKFSLHTHFTLNVWARGDSASRVLGFGEEKKNRF